MSTQQSIAPTTGPPGESCASCGAALASDQRYCLACGARRGETRLPFREVVAARAVASEPADPVVRPPGVTAVAALGCLMLALALGVLLGRAGGETAPPAQVITVGGAAAAPASTTAGASAASADDDAAKTAGKKKAAAKKSSAGATKATNPALRELENLPPEEYQKQSQKLPKVVGTGGKPPPVDPKEKKKPIGGGTDVQDIG